MNNPVDWEDTEQLSSFDENDALFVTDMTGVSMSFSAQSVDPAIHSHYVGGGCMIWHDYEFTGQMKCTDMTSSVGVTFYSRFPNNEGIYYVIKSDLGTTFKLSAEPGGSIFLGAVDSGRTPILDVYFKFRILVENLSDRNHIRAKIWRASDLEPVSWAINAWDTRTSRPQRGTIGLFSSMGGLKYWDDLKVEFIGMPFLKPAHKVSLPDDNTIVVTRDGHNEFVFRSDYGGEIEEVYFWYDGVKSFDVTSSDYTRRTFNSWYDEILLEPFTSSLDRFATMELIEHDAVRTRIYSESYMTDEFNIPTYQKISKIFTLYPTNTMTLTVSRVAEATEAGYDESMFPMILNHRYDFNSDSEEDYNDYGYHDLYFADKYTMLVGERRHDIYLDFVCSDYTGWSDANTIYAMDDNSEGYGLIGWMQSLPRNWNAGDSVTRFLFFHYGDDELVSNALGYPYSRMYRNPSAITWTTGSAWTEITGTYNEMENTYTMNAAGNSVKFTIDGYTTPRYNPVFKIRQYRSLFSANNVRLNGTRIDTFNTAVKPVSDARLVDILWHSTLQDDASILTPQIGSTATRNGLDYVNARYGRGARINNNSDYISVPTSGNLSSSSGMIEFWFTPNYDYDDFLNHTLFGEYGITGEPGDYRLVKKSDNSLYFEIIDDARVYHAAVINLLRRFWYQGKTFHIAVTWDSTKGPENLKIYINGKYFTPQTNYGPVPFTWTPKTDIYFGNDKADPTSQANGVYDEIYIYRGNPRDGVIARAGLTGDPNEYFTDPTNNRTFSFQPLDSFKRGRYMYFGSDSMIRGLNFSFDHPGAGTVTMNWQYWNGTTWAPLTITDGTANFTTSGSLYWSADPAGWKTYSINGYPELYQVRCSLGSGAFGVHPLEKEVRTDILLIHYLGNITKNAQEFSIDDIPISTYTPTATPPPTSTLTFTGTPTPSGTWYSITPTPTSVFTSTMTPTFTISSTPTGTWYSATPTVTSTFSPTLSHTPTGTWYSVTPTGTITLTPTPVETPIPATGSHGIVFIPVLLGIFLLLWRRKTVLR